MPEQGHLALACPDAIHHSLLATGEKCACGELEDVVIHVPGGLQQTIVGTAHHRGSQQCAHTRPEPGNIALFVCSAPATQFKHAVEPKPLTALAAPTRLNL